MIACGSDSRAGSGTLLNALDERRRAAGMSQEALAVAAGLSSRGYRKYLAGHCQPTSDTLKRLQRALDAQARPTGATGDDKRPALILAVWAGFLAHTAPFYGVSVDEARDRATFRSFDPRAHAISRARQAAIYLTNTALDVPQHELARCFGLTRAAICIAMRAVEDRRDDAAFDAMLAGASRAITGGE